MKLFQNLFILSGLLVMTACDTAATAPPTQIVYRFDDHRYLELTGYHCEGALWFTDTKLGIHSQVQEQFYRIYTRPFIHPSEKYIAITEYQGSGFFISKDYGRTWGIARFAPGSGAVQYGADGPQREEIESITVVNDQGYMLTKQGDLYMSSKPFDDPRLEPGGSGIDYTVANSRGQMQTHHIRPGYGGGKWGNEYVSWNSFAGPKHWTIDTYRANFQNIPNKVPAVKNYTGWDRMRCDPDLGLPAK
ncbi:T6SS immunity protein Tli3 family protein (plasmid) [Rahnella variigena]|uniref:T6SS immunity protein Tli3 family protein n=1 Tax=Rahnella variigena TaxID=574964 RepID=UPI003CF94B20